MLCFHALQIVPTFVFANIPIFFTSDFVGKSVIANDNKNFEAKLFFSSSRLKEDIVNMLQFQFNLNYKSFS